MPRTVGISKSGIEPGAIVPLGKSASTPPAGYLLCNGASLLRTSYPRLFAAIGTVWGAADGTHFNIPDLRGRVPRGRDNSTARDPDAASRTASNSGGATGDNVGSVQGHATALPSTPILSGTENSSLAHAHTTPTGAAFWTNDGGFANISFSGGSEAGSKTYNSTISNGPSAHTHSSSSGGDNESRMKNAGVDYIIAYI